MELQQAHACWSLPSAHRKQVVTERRLRARCCFRHLRFTKAATKPFPWGSYSQGRRQTVAAAGRQVCHSEVCSWGHLLSTGMSCVPVPALQHPRASFRKQAAGHGHLRPFPTTKGVKMRKQDRSEGRSSTVHPHRLLPGTCPSRTLSLLPGCSTCSLLSHPQTTSAPQLPHDTRVSVSAHAFVLRAHFRFRILPRLFHWPFPSPCHHVLQGTVTHHLISSSPKLTG